MEQIEERSIRIVFEEYPSKKNLESSVYSKCILKKTVDECNSFSFDKRVDLFTIRDFGKWNVLLSEESNPTEQDVVEQNSRCSSINWGLRLMISSSLLILSFHIS